MSILAPGAAAARSPTLHTLRYRFLGGLRTLRQEAFVRFVLAPILIAGALWILGRYLDFFRAYLVEHAVGDAGPLPGTPSLVLAVMATALLVPRARGEIYALSPATRLAEVLPMTPPARFRTALLVGLAGASTWVVAWMVAALFLAEGAVAPLAVLAWTGRCIVAIALLVPLAMVLVLVLVRLRLRGALLGLILVGLPLLAVVGAASDHPLGEIALLPWWASAAQLELVLAGALGLGSPPRVSAAPWFFLLVLATVAALARWLYLRWRDRDLEIARGLEHRGRRRGPLSAFLLAPGRRRLGGAAAVQTGRDLLLVVRRFSPAVHLAAGTSVLLWVAIVVALPTAASWRQPLATFLAVLAVYPLAALVPFLLRHQLGSGWLERSSGVDPETVWKAKLWSARLLSFPPLLVSCLVLVATWAPSQAGTSELGLGLALLQLLAGWWMVASFLGVGVFETAEHPLLGMLFASLAGLALAALLVFVPRAAWMWLVFFVFGQGAVAGRATRRVELLGTGI